MKFLIVLLLISVSSLSYSKTCKEFSSEYKTVAQITAKMYPGETLRVGISYNQTKCSFTAKQKSGFIAYWKKGSKCYKANYFLRSALDPKNITYRSDKEISFDIEKLYTATKSLNKSLGKRLTVNIFKDCSTETLVSLAGLNYVLENFHVNKVSILSGKISDAVFTGRNHLKSKINIRMR